jgi:hypothetical protein
VTRPAAGSIWCNRHGRPICTGSSRTQSELALARMSTGLPSKGSAETTDPVWGSRRFSKRLPGFSRVPGVSGRQAIHTPECSDGSSTPRLNPTGLHSRERAAISAFEDVSTRAGLLLRGLLQPRLAHVTSRRRGQFDDFRRVETARVSAAVSARLSRTDGRLARS